MRSKIIETPDGTFVCRECRQEVDHCDECFWYFINGDVVICYNDQHFCETCGEAFG